MHSLLNLKQSISTHPQQREHQDLIVPTSFHPLSKIQTDKSLYISVKEQFYFRNRNNH
nr:MAG TPA: hypothetical protein [Crassvirales sp.]